MKEHVTSKGETFVSLCEPHFPSLKLSIVFREDSAGSFTCTIRVNTKNNHIEKFRLSHMFYDEIQSLFGDIFLTKSKIIWDSTGLYGTVKFNFRTFTFYERCCISDFRGEKEFKELLYKEFNIKKKRNNLYDKLYDNVAKIVFLNISNASTCKNFYVEFENLISLINKLKNQ